MIDFHCHLDLYPDPAAVVKQVVDKNLYVLAVTTTPLAWDGTTALVSPGKRIRAALGLHPELIGERSAEVESLCERLPEVKYVGEIGLDGSPQHRSFFPKQVDVFKRILGACEGQGGKVLTVHSRAATGAVLDALEAHPRAGRVVLHWYSGSIKDLDRAIRLGCWFSVGPAMLRGEKGRSLVARMPRQRVVTESDGPFARNGTQPLFPWDVSSATERLAEIWELDSLGVAEVINTNFKLLVDV